MLSLINRMKDPTCGATAEEAGLLYPYLDGLVMNKSGFSDIDLRNYALARRIVKNGPLTPKNRPYLVAALRILRITPYDEKAGAQMERLEMMRFILDFVYRHGGPAFFCSVFDEMADDDNTTDPDYPDIPVLMRADDAMILTLLRHNPGRMIQRAFKGGDPVMVIRVLRLCTANGIDITPEAALTQADDYMPPIPLMASIIRRLKESGEMNLIEGLLPRYRTHYLTTLLTGKRYPFTDNDCIVELYRTLCDYGQREAMLVELRSLPQKLVERAIGAKGYTKLFFAQVKAFGDEEFMALLLERLKTTTQPRVFMRTLVWLAEEKMTPVLGEYYKSCSLEMLNDCLRTSRHNGWNQLLPEPLIRGLLIGACHRADAQQVVPTLLLRTYGHYSNKPVPRKAGVPLMWNVTLMEELVDTLLKGDIENGPAIVDAVTDRLKINMACLEALRETDFMELDYMAFCWAHAIKDRDNCALAGQVLENSWKISSLFSSCGVFGKNYESSDSAMRALFTLLDRMGRMDDLKIERSFGDDGKEPFLLKNYLEEVKFIPHTCRVVLGTMLKLYGQEIFDKQVLASVKKKDLKHCVKNGTVDVIHCLLELTTSKARQHVLKALPPGWRTALMEQKPKHEAWQAVGAGPWRWHAVVNYFPPFNRDFSPWKFKKDLYNNILRDINRLMSIEGSNRKNDNAATAAYRLATLFANREEVERYLNLYITRWANGSRTPVFDAVSKITPPLQGIWDVNRWKALVFRFGPAVSRYLQFAPAIEAHVQEKSLPFPRTPEETCAYAALFYYKRAAENPAFAALCLKYEITEDKFNQGLDVLARAVKSNALPDLAIDGADIGLNNFYMEKLPAGDMRGLVMGKITNDCTYLGNNGEQCAIRGTTSADCGFYVWKHKTNGKITADDPIIAQSWAWLGKDGNLVFDSFERLGAAYDYLAVPFLEHYAHEIARRPELGITGGVRLGTHGGHDGAAIPFNRAAQSDTPRDGALFMDALFQYEVPAVDHRVAIAALTCG